MGKILGGLLLALKLDIVQYADMDRVLYLDGGDKKDWQFLHPMSSQVFYADSPYTNAANSGGKAARSLPLINHKNNHIHTKNLKQFP